MEALVRSRRGVRLRRIDVVDWGSPIARAHAIYRLPALVLYEGERLVSRDTAWILRRLRDL